MKREKKRMQVWRRLRVDGLAPEECEDWKLAGETFAVSAAQAKNNIRHRLGEPGANNSEWYHAWYEYDVVEVR